eukprot:TRINITY_DN1857_c0_g1_i3.p1 TRINITY_DN1857_c0_g1~~TRINITY_DN1857_c0_g1_i3.p1  ORF type:complete len:188 (-),score=7.30 TRINITY_DN1857_c0_g1_i3:411-974(-)
MSFFNNTSVQQCCNISYCKIIDYCRALLSLCWLHHPADYILAAAAIFSPALPLHRNSPLPAADAGAGRYHGVAPLQQRSDFKAQRHHSGFMLMHLRCHMLRRRHSKRQHNSLAPRLLLGLMLVAALAEPLLHPGRCTYTYPFAGAAATTATFPSRYVGTLAVVSCAPLRKQLAQETTGIPGTCGVFA